MKKPLLFLSFIYLQTIGFAQVANDDCTTAMDYGVLPFSAQPPCPNGAAPYVGDNNDLTNVTPSTPYYYMSGCNGYTATTTSFADDIWYKYRGNSQSTDIMISGMDTVHVNFYYGTSCNNLQPSACFTYIPSYSDTVFSIYSTNDTVNFYNYIQISSNVSGKQFWYFVCINQSPIFTSVSVYGTIHTNNSVSTTENPNGNDVNIYPNPAGRFLFLDYDAQLKTPVITLRSLLNEEITINYKASNGKAIVDLGTIANGFYFVSVFTDKGVVVKKISLQIP